MTNDSVDIMTNGKIMLNFLTAAMKAEHTIKRAREKERIHEREIEL